MVSELYILDVEWHPATDKVMAIMKSWLTRMNEEVIVRMISVKYVAAEGSNTIDREG